MNIKEEHSIVKRMIENKIRQIKIEYEELYQRCFPIYEVDYADTVLNGQIINCLKCQIEIDTLKEALSYFEIADSYYNK